MQRWAIVFLFFLVGPATAAEQPSPVDLRAAYCFGYTTDALRDMNADESANDAAWYEMQRTVETQLRRLRRYVMLRGLQVELLGIQAAIMHGKQDFQRVNRYMEGCYPPCYTLTDATKRTACIDHCTAANPLKANIEHCADLSWLPY